jgi:NAD(P)-dependent dehydrogenase (short-subunit alcohol dehydrogenase family)
MHENKMARIKKPEFKSSLDKTLSAIPLGRIGDMDDMKGLAVFLASDALAYMNGQILINDGGMLAK